MPIILAQFLCSNLEWMEKGEGTKTRFEKNHIFEGSGKDSLDDRFVHS